MNNIDQVTTIPEAVEKYGLNKYNLAKAIRRESYNFEQGVNCRKSGSGKNAPWLIDNKAVEEYKRKSN